MKQIISFFAGLPEWLKWAIIVFLAGVVGQFGKSLTLAIIGYIKNRKSGGGRGDKNKPVPGKVENNYKLKKKELKALAKLEKKKAKARKKENK